MICCLILLEKNERRVSRLFGRIGRADRPLATANDLIDHMRIVIRADDEFAGHLRFGVWHRLGAHRGAMMGLR